MGQMCGQIGVVSSVLLSIGPGATIFRVLATGNTSSMPFYQSLLAFLNNMVCRLRPRVWVS